MSTLDWSNFKHPCLQSKRCFIFFFSFVQQITTKPQSQTKLRPAIWILPSFFNSNHIIIMQNKKKEEKKRGKSKWYNNNNKDACKGEAEREGKRKNTFLAQKTGDNKKADERSGPKQNKETHKIWTEQLTILLPSSTSPSGLSSCSLLVIWTGIQRPISSDSSVQSSSKARASKPASKVTDNLHQRSQIIPISWKLQWTRNAELLQHQKKVENTNCRIAVIKRTY